MATPGAKKTAAKKTSVKKPVMTKDENKAEEKKLDRELKNLNFKSLNTRYIKLGKWGQGTKYGKKIHAHMAMTQTNNITHPNYALANVPVSMIRLYFQNNKAKVDYLVGKKGSIMNGPNKGDMLTAYGAIKVRNARQQKK
jgi:hypothetical protein